MASSEPRPLLLAVNALVALADAYLLAVAAEHGATLLTLDRRIVPRKGGQSRVEVLTP